MLLHEIKEREYRFRLALRMGLPIFALVVALIINTFIDNSINLSTTFYVEATLMVAVSIYFIFYIIYNGFDVQITDIVSKTFTREYLYTYLKKKIDTSHNYTLLLFRIDNLQDINTLYGMKNEDKVIFEVAQWIGKYIQNRGENNFPIGHLKGGNFIVGLEGNKSKHITLLEMTLLKMSEFKVDDMEVKISGAITDTSFSNELEYMIEELLETQENNKSSLENSEKITPNELEILVINALKNRRFTIMAQDVFENREVIFKECFVKLKKEDNSFIHQKNYMKVISKLGLTLEYDLMLLETLVSSVGLYDNSYALNISSSSLRNRLFLQKAKELFGENQTLQKSVIFILSENEYYSHIHKYNAIIKSLKKYGVKIAIDRLGSLHTSFLYLRDLEIDIVRFDSFYSKETQTKEVENILQGFNVMAHAKGVKTWIKMIESEDLFDALKMIDVDYRQGKYLSSLEKIYES